MLNLIMVLHCHQPVGNFDHVFKMAMERCYGPLLQILNSHPSVKVGLHFSGPLLEWMENNQPEGLELMADMVKKKQLEMLSGGFFEPLLATIPVRDAKGQVRMMNDYILKRFGCVSTGFWLAERVWDPGLPMILEGTGMAYTVVDDTHFYYAGLRPHEIHGMYLTEKEGHTLNLLATPMVMRYLIPFKPVEEVIGHLRVQEDMGHDLALYGDDGEKFGLWPGTYDWVIRKGWLEHFFAAIEDNHDWLKTTLPGDFVSTHSPLGRLYLPQASYEEMTEWALPPERAYFLESIIKSLKDDGRWDDWRPFVRGGVWDNFLVKYEESNRMHKKMIFLSERGALDAEARKYLWRAQCNCAYWHGVFGGLYLGHLRRAVYENLIKAHEYLISESDKDIGMFHGDIHKDGFEETLMWNREMTLGLAPSKGGGIYELCHLRKRMNLCDTLTRRFEAYHHHIGDRNGMNSGEEGISSIHDLTQSGAEELKRLLVYDPYTKISLLDHFLGTDVTPHGYASCDYHEEGDFLSGNYIIERSRVAPDSAMVKLYRRGFIDSKPLFLSKMIGIAGNAHIKIEYEFDNQGTEALSTRYGCEFNINLYSDQDPGRYCFAPESGRRWELSEKAEEDHLTRFELVNKTEGLNISFQFSRSVSLWSFPIMTVSKSEEGFDYTYQGTSLLFLFPLDLLPGQGEQICIQISLVES